MATIFNSKSSAAVILCMNCYGIRAGKGMRTMRATMTMMINGDDENDGFGSSTNVFQGENEWCAEQEWSALTRHTFRCPRLMTAGLIDLTSTTEISFRSVDDVDLFFHLSATPLAVEVFVVSCCCYFVLKRIEGQDRKFGIL
jgi:hypothetical protein